MKRKPRKSKTTLFQAAVEATPDVAGYFQPGLQALGRYSEKIELTDPKKSDGSLDIDSCTRHKYPNENRWDYAVSYDARVYFIEIHSAKTKEVGVVLRKLRWLRDWLLQEAPAIQKMQAESPAFFWLQSKKFDVLPGSPQARQLAKANLRPIPKLTLT